MLTNVYAFKRKHRCLMIAGHGGWHTSRVKKIK